MSTTYSATYFTAAGHFYQATIFLSAVTISIRYRDEENQEKDVHWLVNDLIDFRQQDMNSELQYRNQLGETERLVIRDEQLVQALKKNLAHHRLFGKAHSRVLGSIWIKLALIVGIILTALVLVYLWLMPLLGERMAKGFAKEKEIGMGEQMYQAVLQHYTVDPRKTVILNDFYKQLHYETGYPVKITVVESNEVNAFAIPGGHNSILDNMKSPDELAALLGHEASHIALRHSLRGIFRDLARQMFLSLIVGSESGIASVVVDNANALKQLQYSRSLETEADNNGLQLMAKNNINVQGMLRLMTMLQKESSGGVEPSPFLSTHPVVKDRIRNIETQIQQLPAVTTSNENLRQLFHSIYE
jgi:Zn-dependent protease with chaperone function